MRVPRDIQIQAVLSTATTEVLSPYLPPGVSRADVPPGELISVSIDEVAQYVSVHGFPSAVVHDSSRDDASQCDSVQRIVEDTSGWTVTYFERGRSFDAKRYASRSAAVREVVRRLLRGALLELGVLYKRAHPEVVMALPEALADDRDEAPGGLPDVTWRAQQ